MFLTNICFKITTDVMQNLATQELLISIEKYFNLTLISELDFGLLFEI